MKQGEMYNAFKHTNKDIDPGMMQHFLAIVHYLTGLIGDNPFNDKWIGKKKHVTSARKNPTLLMTK